MLSCTKYTSDPLHCVTVVVTIYVDVDDNDELSFALVVPGEQKKSHSDAKQRRRENAGVMERPRWRY